MRTAALLATLLIALQACSTSTQSAPVSEYQQPNSLMAGEITRRVEQIPYQHREELLENLVWLAHTGEQTIPSLLQGLQHANPKVRSSCAWVLGRVGDRRTIPNLQEVMQDRDQTVRMECARTLVLLGDLAWSPVLIEGLDSERKEVRFLCHEALKTATGHDFGYDHLNGDKAQMQVAVLRWRQWWGEFSGDQLFAQSYQQQHNLQSVPAQPMGETQILTPAGRSPGDNAMLEVELGNPATNPAATPEPAGNSGNPNQGTQPVEPPTVPPATNPNGSTQPNGGD